jgi:hypothetical protein
MPRNYGPAIGALLVAAALFILAENAFAPSFQACVDPDAAQQAWAGLKANPWLVGIAAKTELVCSVRLIDAHSGFFAAFAAFILAGFAFALWRIGEVQAVELRRSVDHSIALQSPMVFVTEVSIEPEVWGAEDNWVSLPSCKCNLVVHFENFGLSPAVILSACLEWKFAAELPAQPTYEHVRPMATGTILRPNGRESFDWDRQFNIEFSSGEIFAERRGTTHLWVYGFVDFRGGIGRTHRARFCARWERGDFAGHPYRFIEDGPAHYRGHAHEE